MAAKMKKLIAILCITAMILQCVSLAALSEDQEEAVAEISADAAEVAEGAVSAEETLDLAPAGTAIEPEQAEVSESASSVPEKSSAPAAPVIQEEVSAEQELTGSDEEIFAKPAQPETDDETPEEPVQSVTVEETPTEQEQPETVEETSAEPEQPETDKANPVDPEQPGTVEETPAEPTQSETVEETPAEPAQSETAEETPAEPAQSETAEETSAEPAQSETVEETSAELVESGTETEVPEEPEGQDIQEEDEALTKELEADEQADTAETEPEEGLQESQEEIQPDSIQQGYGAVQCALSGEKSYIIRFIPEQTEEVQINLKADYAFSMKLKDEISGSECGAGSNENNEIIIKRNVQAGEPMLMTLDADTSVTITVEFAPAWNEETAEETAPAAETESITEQETAKEPADETEPDEAAEEDEESEETEEAEEDAGEDPSANVEVIVTKAVQPGEAWEGVVRDTKPAILKLDIEQAGNVHVIVESQQAVWATVEKTDRREEDPSRTFSDPETGLLVISLGAEQGSYLISIAPEAAGDYAMVTVLFLDDEAYAAWVATQGTNKEQKTAEKTDHPEEETEFILPEDRSIHIDLTWDTDDPQIGDTAHFTSVLTGYETVAYTLQWQTSCDEVIWTDYPAATEPQLDVVTTEELEETYFRLVIYVESEKPEE